MKKDKLEEIKAILAKSRKIPVSRNDRFWMETIEFLGSITKSAEYPDFLKSWAKEVLSVIKDMDKFTILLVLPSDGCWGIYAENKSDFMFSYNETRNIYISYRLYKYLKEKNAYDFLAGLLLHEVAEFIMRLRAEKKGSIVDINKNHGEAMRLERELLGKGKQAETLLQDLFIDLVKMEFERKRVVLDKQDIYVENCVVNGEEIIAEINSFEDGAESFITAREYPPDRIGGGESASNSSRNKILRGSAAEYFIVELTPGQKKTVPYSNGKFVLKAEEFNSTFDLENADFSEYCGLMKILDDYFVEESVIHKEGPFLELLSYLRRLDFYNARDNVLLKLLWVYKSRPFQWGVGYRQKGRDKEKYFNRQRIRHEFLYNVFLLADEYNSYILVLDIVRKYWADGKLVKDNLKEVTNKVYEQKIKILPESFYREKSEKERIKENSVSWFSNMDKVPTFANMQALQYVETIPRHINEYYKKIGKPKDTENYNGSIDAELLLHEQILNILKNINLFLQEGRGYSGVKRKEDARVCELNMVRVHFWKDRNIFNRREKVGISTFDKKGCGIAEIIDVKEYSIVVFLDDAGVEIPDSGFIKKLEEEDITIDVSLLAIGKLGKHAEIWRCLFERTKEESGTVHGGDIDFFNMAIKDDESQSYAVQNGITGSGVTIIQGPPGTGKTTVIAEVILQFLKMGKKVLLTSQTNNAVDNALNEVMKWKDISMGAGRVASSKEKIADEAVKKIWIKSKRELEEFENRYMHGYVIGATNVGTHTLDIMKGRDFDVLVMDEAGKANLVESLLPMLLIKDKGQIVIVGDHKQGSPFAYDDDVVDLFVEKEIELYNKSVIQKDKEVLLAERLNQSLFERLIEEGRKSIMLKVNYRSTPEIVGLVSKLFYNNALVPFRKPLGKAKSVIIVDTSRKADINTRKETEVIIEGESKGYKNIYEAQLVVEELKESLKYKYLNTGIRGKEITGVTILAPYIFQVDEIRKQISQGLIGRLPNAAVEDLVDNVSTIDSFQGREDEIVIISFTRSNDNPYEAGFLRELNRINVALSRAKRKMVLIGDFETLMNIQRGKDAESIREIFKGIYNFR